MGTVNYKTSDIITLGLRPYEPRDFELDPDFMEDARKHCEENGCSIFDWIEGTINEYTEDDQQTAENIISRYSFEFFQVSVEPGYYEGFSIDIANNLPSEFCDEDERAQAFADVQSLRDLLTCLVFDACLCEVWPGWCTTYRDTDQSKTAIRKATRALLADVADAPTETEVD